MRAYDACKLTLDIVDASAKTEYGDQNFRVIEHQFNIERYPFVKDGKLQWMGKSNLYQLEDAFGFEPLFFDDSGNRLEPRVTKTGNKVGPKDSKRKLNPDFFNAYFTEDGNPKMENWAEKVVYADIEIETSEQYGDKNVIKAFRKAPRG